MSYYGEGLRTGLDKHKSYRLNDSHSAICCPPTLFDARNDLVMGGRQSDEEGEATICGRWQHRVMKRGDTAHDTGDGKPNKWKRTRQREDLKKG